MSRRISMLFVVMLLLTFMATACTKNAEQATGDDRPNMDDDSVPPMDDDDNGDDDSGDDDSGDDDSGDDDSGDDDTGGAPVEIVLPEDGSTIVGTQADVRVIFRNNPDTIKVLLDDTDVTDLLAYSGGEATGELTNLTIAIHVLKAQAWYGETEEGDQVQFTMVEGARIEMTLSADQVLVGDQVTASWVVYDDTGADVTAEAEVALSVDPNGGVTINGDQITFEAAGNFEVTAQTEWDAQILSDTDTVVVTEEATAASVEITCTPAEITAGGSSYCEPTIYDDDGNVISGAVTFTADPAEGVTIDGNELTMTRAGQVTVTGTVVGTDVAGTDQVTVNAGEPVNLELTLDPAEIEVEHSTTANAALVDEYGNPISNPQVTLEISPSQGMEINGMEITAHRAGFFVVTAYTTGHLLEDQAELTVTETSKPTIVITNPARGSFVTSPSISIVGTATDEYSDITRVEVNGAEANFDPYTGGFSLGLSLSPGLTIFIVNAWDSFDNMGTATVSVMYAPSYVLNGQPVNGAVGARINQTGLDSIEVIGEQLIEEYRDQIMGLIPNPLFYDSEELWGVQIYEVAAYCTAVNYNPVNLELTPINGGLHLYAGAANVSVLGYIDYSIFKNGAPAKDTLDFSVTASSLTLTGDLMISASGGALQVNLVNINVGLNDFTVSITNGGLLGDILNLVIDLLDSTIRDLLTTTIQEMIVDTVPPMIQELLDSLDLSFDYSLLWFDYHFAANFAEANFTPGGSELWLNTQMWYGDDPNMSAPGPNAINLPGSLRTNNPRPTLNQYVPGTGTPYGFAAILGDDMINNLLNVAHRSGLMSLDLDQETLQQLGIDFELTTTYLFLFMPGIVPAFGLDKPVIIKLRPLLPPVMILNPQKGLSTELQVGDFVLEWYCIPEEGGEEVLFAKVALALFAPVDISVTEQQTINIEFGDMEMYSDLFEEPVFEIGDAFFEELLPGLVQLLVPALLGGLLEEIPIPSFEGFTLNVLGFMPVGPANDWAGLFGDLIQVRLGELLGLPNYYYNF